MKDDIIKRLKDISEALHIDGATISLEYPENPDHGDFTSNVAMVNAKKLGLSGRELAERIVTEFKKDLPESVQSVEVAGPGFINFSTRDQLIAEQVILASTKKELKGGIVLIEYTDPNTFKVFHIGHLMSNAVGESLSRLIEFFGTQVIRICYPSDIGLHIAKAIWAMQRNMTTIPNEQAAIQEKTAFLGRMYVLGTIAYEQDSLAKDAIEALNKALYAKSNNEINALYEKGRRWSIEHFDQLYTTLGTRFDEVIYESDMAPVGLEIVKEFLKKDIFEVSQGAVVFKGEKFGLHTRVFINAQGIATYEAKDLGLNVTKFKKFPEADLSIIVTASEQNEYFKVVTKVISLVDVKDGSKTKHIGHGMMRFADGKMSSRTGNVVTADDLITDMKTLVMNKIAHRDFDASQKEEIATDIAIGAIKYTILRSSVGSDIVFDSASSISFEGDSGPYLQYSAVRAASILEKAGAAEASKGRGLSEQRVSGASSAGLEKATADPGFKVGFLEKLLVRFPDVVEHARSEYAPQIVANYLINLAGAFNSFYASQTIIDEKDPLSLYRVELTRAFLKVMTDGLWLLGIKVPKKM